MARWILALAALSFSCYGQNSYGRLSGRVSDSLDAMVGGAAVRAVQVGTNITSSTTTNGEGVFELLNLLPGEYKLTVEMQGFKRFERGPLEVRVGDVVAIDVKLELGAMAETVTVTSESPLIEAATASMGQVVDMKQIQSLPLPGGSVNYLMQLSPGVISTNAPTHGWLPQARDSVSNIAVNGSRTRSSEFQLDGVPNMAQDGIIAFQPPPEMIQEFRVQTAAYDAAVGRFTGAYVNMVPRSGANAVHGSLWFSHLSRPLMTHPFFVNRQLYDLRTGPVTAEKRNSVWPATKTNRYRATITGPVVIPKLYNGKNKTFFSYGNDFMLRVFAGQGFQTVPTEEQRRGDFSALLRLGGNYQIYDPATIAAAANGRFSRQPLAGNVIPASRISAAAVKLMSFWPLPNAVGTADFRNNYQSPPANRIDYMSHLARIDQVINEKHRFYISGSGSSVQGDQGRALRNDALGNLTDNQYRGFVFDDVYTVSPTFVLNARYGITRMKNMGDPPSMGFDITQLGWPSSLVNQFEKELYYLPSIDVDGYAGFTNNNPTRTAFTYHFVAGTATAIKGNHSLRFGGEYRAHQENNINYGQYQPNIAFGNTWTRGPLDTSPVAPIGQGMASFLMGLPTSGAIDRNTTLTQQSSYMGLFVHDDFKLTRKLTLNVGLRYEYEFPTTERFNRFNRGFDFTTPSPISAAALANYARAPIPEVPASAFRTLGGMTFAGVGGAPRTLWNGDKNNFAPRIGIAYLVRPKTVVRVGYGIYFESLGTDRVDVGQQGFDQRTSLIPSNDNGLTFAATLANPFPNGLLQAAGNTLGLRTFLGRSPSFFYTDRKAAYSQRWSFSVQQELRGRMMVEAGYTGNRGTGLGIGRDLNAVPAEYLSRSPERDQARIDFLNRQVPNPFFGIAEFAGSGLQARNVAVSALLQPYPHFAAVNSTFNDGFSWYHAGHVRFERRFQQGYSVGATYTWSKFMEAVERLNAQDLYPHKAISPQDRPHHVVVNFQVELPFGRGKAIAARQGWVNQIIGGWSTQAIYQWQSGPPIGFGNILYRGVLADMVLPYGERTVERWFNTNAGFERDNTKTLGGNLRTFPLRLTGLRADGWNNWDLSAFKSFRLREGLTLQFRAEAQDALNHAMFQGPNTAPVNTLFGQVTATIWSEQRKITMAAKLVW